MPAKRRRPYPYGTSRHTTHPDLLRLRSGPSHTLIPIDSQIPSPFKIGPSELAGLVKEKNLTSLRQLGGVHKVASCLATDVSGGISGELDDLARRQNTYGVNTFKQSAKGFFHFLLEAFKDVTHLILLVCAGLSPGLAIKENRLKEGWYSGWSSFFSVFLMIVLSSMSKCQRNRQASDNIHIQVRRKGREQLVSIFEIVVGDVVCLKKNDQVPADGLFLYGRSLWVDESSMTGKSCCVEEKNKQNPFLFSGTRVVEGDARMLVTAVGMNTEEGEIWSSTSQDSSEQTPLQAQLNEFTSLISKVGLAVNFLVLVVQQICYFTGRRKDAKQEFVAGQTIGDNVINSLGGKIAATVTIVSAMIPEGLPIAVTIIFAYSVKCMMKHQVMVRKLSACETMGSVTTICTNKTGTLTMNQMEVMYRRNPKKPPAVLNLIKDGVALNTTGSISKPSSGSKYEFSGAPTEKAILSWAVGQLRMDMEETKKNYEVIQVEAFDSQKKRSGVLIKNRTDSTVHVHWKGEAEVVLAMCSRFYKRGEMEEDLDQSTRSRYEGIIERKVAGGLRCIAFAHKQVSEEATKEREDGKKIQEDGMTFLGFVGIGDPCRPATMSKIQKIRKIRSCQDFGMNIKIMTGDNIFTAQAIAKNLGILKSGNNISRGFIEEGEEFNEATPEERLQRVDSIRVMAGSSRDHKLLMVKCLKEKGDVVAVIGNGMNDVLALKEANIGLLMGKQSAEVAKESSDIVILDNNIGSVALVLCWGRCIHDNIQKFIQFKLTVNMAALLINFVAAVSSGDVSLTAVQLLWVNLMVDTLGAFALSTEQPTRKLMKKPPVDRKEPIITKVMWRNLMGQAIYRVAVLLTIQFKGELIFGMDEAVKRTLIFNAFVLCQVFSLFNAKELKKKNVFKCIKKNKLFLGIIFVMVVLQVVMVEFLKWFAVTERLSWGQWGACVGIAAASWPIGWVVKCIPVPDAPIFQRIREVIEPVMKFMSGE